MGVVSCDWRIWCLDCEEENYFSDANHQEELMRKLIEQAPAIVAFAPALRALGGDVKFETYYGSVDPDWFEKHAGHRLVPRDEYGRCLDECGTRTTCSACEHPDRCRLPTKHEGEHSPKRPK